MNRLSGLGLQVASWSRPVQRNMGQQIGIICHICGGYPADTDRRSPDATGGVSYGLCE